MSEFFRKAVSHPPRVKAAKIDSLNGVGLMTQLEFHGPHAPPSLAEQVATRIHSYAHGRIRNLIVEESRGTLVVRGEARTWHAKQLALQGVLEVLPEGRFSECITVVCPDLVSR